MALVVALFCLPLAVDLGRADLENDEAIYAFAVDTMVRTGDWLTPKSITDEHSPFLEKPYLQLGDAPKLSASESLVLMWHTENTPSD